MLPKVLTIAGSDSSGGAGIQADLKTFAALGTYGMTAVTALTAQNTRGVHAILEIAPAFVKDQIDAVLLDIGADAVKTGMLASAAIVEVVADALERHRVPNVVVDPVMVAKGGRRLLREDAIGTLRRLLVPLADVLTPNTEEAAVLAGVAKIESIEESRRAAEKLREMGAKAVLVKGGHLTGGTCDDVWFDGREWAILSAPRLSNPHTHGTGCTLSAALAAFLARGFSPLEAARSAKRFVTQAIRTARPLGGGTGPIQPSREWKERKSDTEEH